MLGAIIGDLCGSPYEFIDYDVPYNFPLFIRGCTYTDDTVMTVAVAKTLLECGECENEKKFKNTLIHNMKTFGRKYRDAGFGGRFIEWLWSLSSKPYNSFGNGSAMRVSPIGWVFDTLDKTRQVARWSAEVTHNHPEGVKAAECTAGIIFLARHNYDLNYIEQWAKTNFDYDIGNIPRSDYVSCQTSMPICLKALYNSTDFESALRNAISFGYDTDTYGAITGAMAEAMYDIDPELILRAVGYLPYDFLDVLNEFLNIRKEPVNGLRDL